MSRAFGTGSPLYFHCPAWRRLSDRDRCWAYDLHTVRRTGRTKPRKPGTGAVGTRSLLESHEYVCSCGHRGWTNHLDILFREVKEPE